jgi:Spy/CpxP family protein refolding chaperone
MRAWSALIMNGDLMSKITAAALGAALILGISGIATAQGTVRRPGGQRQGVGPGARNRGGIDGRLAKELNLTDAQKAKIQAIHAKYKPRFEAIRSQVNKQGVSARTLRQKGDTAGARVAAAKTRAELRQRTQPIRLQEQAEIRSVLTPEQRVKFDAAKSRKRDGTDKQRRARLENRMDRLRYKRG